MISSKNKTACDVVTFKNNAYLCGGYGERHDSREIDYVRKLLL